MPDVGTSPFGFAGADASRVANYGTAGAPGVPGLGSQIGGWMQQNQALTSGLGALGATAFGGASTGTAPTARVKLTKSGKKLETALYESIKGLFPENLASRFVGAAKKMEQQRQKLSQGVFKGATARDPGRAMSGGVAKAFLGETRARLGGAAEGPRQAGEARRGFALNQMGQMQNFMNIQMQTPVLRAQASLINQQMAQQRGAQRGAALGGMAQLLALSRIGTA